MATAWFGFITTLAGVLIGALTTYLIQERNWKREARRQLYGSFVGECRVWLDSIAHVAYAIQHDFSASAREPHWERANTGRARVFGLRAQIDLLGTRPTRTTARDLERSMDSLNEIIHNYGHEGGHPPDVMAYRADFDSILDGFIRAASDELRVSRLP